MATIGVCIAVYIAGRVGMVLARVATGLIVAMLNVIAVRILRYGPNRPPPDNFGFMELHGRVEALLDGCIAGLLAGVTMPLVLGPYFAWPAKAAFIIAVYMFFGPYWSLLFRVARSESASSNVGVYIPPLMQVELSNAMTAFTLCVGAFSFLVWGGWPANPWYWVMMLAVIRFVPWFWIGVAADWMAMRKAVGPMVKQPTTTMTKWTTAPPRDNESAGGESEQTVLIDGLECAPNNGHAPTRAGTSAPAAALPTCAAGPTGLDPISRS